MYHKALVKDAEWRPRNKYWDKYDTLLFCQLLVFAVLLRIKCQTWKDLYRSFSRGLLWTTL